jgi:hypothetical protein
MTRSHLIRATFCLLLAPLVARADHLPDQLHATGKAETKLAGLSITKDGESVSEAIKLYGEPAEKNVAANNPAWIGYRWTFGKAVLEVETVNGRMTGVYVEGTADGPASRTGAGLKLGDDLKRLKAIYGPKFEDRAYPARSIGGEVKRRKDRVPHSGVWENHRVTIQWNEPEYMLTVGLDDRGRIVSLWLLRPECFPGECN